MGHSLKNEIRVSFIGNNKGVDRTAGLVVVSGDREEEVMGENYGGVLS